MILIICCAFLMVTSEFHAAETVNDSWSDLITWRDQFGHPAKAEHVTLMRNGQLVLMGALIGEFTMRPTPLGAGVPSDQAVWLFDNSELYEDLGKQPACAGHTLLSDGRLFVVGGTDWGHGTGLEWAVTYNGAGFRLIPEPMIGVGEDPVLGPIRWYPAVTRLADSRILVTAGSSKFTQWPFVKNLSVEAYDPASSSWELVSAHDDAPPEIFNRDYTHVFQLPEAMETHDILMFGEYGFPVFLSTLSGSWNVMEDRRPHDPGEFPLTPNHGASSLLLPIRVVNGEWGYANGSVLMAGGEAGSSYEHHVDIFDPASHEWKNRIDMTTRRHHPSTVLLPDGRILIVAGHSHQTAPEVLGSAQLIDPADGFSMSFGQSNYTEVRGYHTVTVLLPDGRVLVGSGNPGDLAGHERTDFRYYYPDYMSESQPVILERQAPGILEYGKRYEIPWVSEKPISEVVVIGLGSMTHSVDMNQRYVQLRVLGGDENSTSFLAPPDSSIAPAGHYMLFILDENRTPSVAKIVQIRGATPRGSIHRPSVTRR